MLIFCLMIASSGSLDLSYPFNCSSYVCESYDQTNDLCNENCMNPSCNYDSPDNSSPSWFKRFVSSGCLNNCLWNYCNPSNLGNGVCDTDCNIIECGYDLGDCGYCASGCTKSMLINNVCDSACNVAACMYDNNACGWCAPGCFIEDLSSTICKSACNVESCDYQNYVCSSNFCAPECSPEKYSDTMCQEECNNEACNYDNWKCTCSTGCTDAMKNDKTTCHPECNTDECNYQQGMCGDCAASCFNSMLGDGICNMECYDENCEYDYGDCGCSPGCSSIYKNNAWVWNASNPCNPYCLVEDCLFNFGVCNDGFLIRAAFFQQLLKDDPNYPLYLGECTMSSTCSESKLREIDSSGVITTCTDECKSTSCFNCMGLQATSNICTRTGTNCLLCATSKQLYNQCNTQCPSGYAVVPQLNSVFLNTEVCLRVPLDSTFRNPFLIYVDPTYGNDINAGDQAHPLKSFSAALLKVTKRYTKIILNPGIHQFSVSTSSTSSLITNQYSPLSSSVDLYLKELWIVGSSSTNRPTIQMTKDNMMLFSPVKTMYIKDLIFDGRYSLVQGCVADTCMYCPYYEKHQVWYSNDKNQLINTIQNYGANCSANFATTNFITIQSGNSLIMENVDVNNFQQQYNAFIYSKGSVTLHSVNFNRIQASPTNSFIFIDKSDDNSDFTYTSGSVKNLNYGYEYRTDLVQSGFFKSNSLNNALIDSVKFEYNMVVSGSDQTKSNNYLFSFLNSLGIINFNNCVFSKNFVNGIIYVDSRTLTYSKWTVDSYYNVKELAQIHLQIQNTDFEYIGSLNTLISLYMKNVMQNFQLTSCRFSKIAANSEGLIFIEHDGTKTDKETIGAWTYLDVGFYSVKTWITPRMIKITNITMSDVYYGGYVLELKFYSNVYISEINSTNLRSFSLEQINSYIIDTFKGNTYVSEYLTSSAFTISDPIAAWYFEDLYYLKLSLFNITNSFCSSCYPGIEAIEILTLEISSLTLNNIQTSNQYSVIKLLDSNDISIISLNMYLLSTTSGSVFDINNGIKLILTNAVLFGVNSIFKSAISIDSLQNIIITNFTCSSCYSTRGNGGGLYILPATAESVVNLTNLYCNNCNSNSGYGGGVYFESYSSDLFHNVTWKNLTFESCSAVDGVGFYLTDRLSFNSAFIQDVFFYNSKSLQGSMISDNHKKGLLNIMNILVNNSNGYFTAIKGSYSWGTQMLKVTNCYIINSLATNAMAYLASLSSSTSVIFTNVTIKKSSSLSFNVYQLELTITDFTLDSGSGIQLQQSSSVTAYNLNFTYLTGVAVYSSSSYFSCNLCSFQHCINGPVLFFQEKTNFTIQNSVFYNLTSSNPGIALFINSCPYVNTFKNCSFIKGISTQGSMLELQASNLTIISSIIKENDSKSMTSGISMISSSIIIYDTKFALQKSGMGGFIYCSSYSQVTINNCDFRSATASTGGAITSVLSHVIISSSNFYNLTASTYGGAIYSITSSNLTLENCIFDYCGSNGTGLVIYFLGASLKIDKSSFNSTHTKYSEVYADSSGDISITYTNFYSVNSLSSGISLAYISNVLINSCNFSGLNNSISIYSIESNANPFRIINSNFINNSAWFGAGLLLESASVSIENCLFYNNTAGYGGAIYFTCPNSDCAFNISNSTFTSNTALLAGGAIKWNDMKPNITNVSYFDNKSPYGSNSASLPANLKLSNRLRQLDAIECQPGVTCNATILITLLDSEDNAMSLDNSSSASMVANSTSYSVSGITKVVANNGIFNFSNFTISGLPGSYIDIIISTTTIDPSNAEKVGDSKNYSDSLTFSVYLRPCTLGEQSSSTACISCTSQSYLIDPAPVCNACPSGGICPGGWYLYPASGYWKSSKFSEVIYSCPLSSACLGSLLDDDFTGTCANGYTGKKCLACENGYSRSGSYKCGKCPDDGINALIIIFILIGIVVVCVILVRSTLNSAYSPKALYSIYIKIFTNYIQLVFLTTQFELKWPYYVQNLFSAQKSIATASDQLYSTDCYFKNVGKSYEDIYYDKLLLTLFLPIIIWVASFAVWFAICCVKKTWSYLTKEYFTTMIVLYFLVYPNIVKTVFSVFSCTYIDGEGYFISDNLIIKCWDSKHLKYSISIAVPGILVWALGMPALVSVLIAKRRKYLSSDRNRVIFGFIYNGYKPSRFFWEFFIMYRKVLILCVAVFMTTQSQEIQALTLILILLSSLYMQYEFKPYNKRQLNHMETEAILTASITIYCGMYYLTDSIGDGLKTFLFICILIGNLYFIIYWLYYMFQAIIEILSSFSSSLRRLIGKTNPYPEYISADPRVKQGVYIDHDDDGNKIFTLLPKETNLHKRAKLEGINNIRDLFFESVKRLTEKLDVTDLDNEVAGKESEGNNEEVIVADYEERKHDISKMIE